MIEWYYDADSTLRYSVEESKDFPSNMLSSRFLMIHDPSAGSQHNVSDTSSRQELIDPVLHIPKTNVEPRRNDPTFIQTSIELNHNFARTMIVNFLKLSDIAYYPSAFNPENKIKKMFRKRKRPLLMEQEIGV